MNIGNNTGPDSSTHDEDPAKILDPQPAAAAVFTECLERGKVFAKHSSHP